GGGGGGNNGGGFEIIGSDLVTGGATTPLNPPLLSTPAEGATNVDVKNFTVTWGSRQGADEFQVEVSTDRFFKNRAIIFTSGPLPSSAPQADGVLQSFKVDLTAQPALLSDPTFIADITTGTGNIYWRVGARNSQDWPGPINWLSHDPHDPDKTFRWV